MKVIIFLFVFLFLFVCSLQAQIDTTSLSFYPLNDGTYWEYVHITDDWFFPPMTYYYYYSYLVTGDTTLPNGIVYKSIQIKEIGTTNISYSFERVDTASCNVYKYDNYSNIEFLIDSLKSQSGDSCNATRTQFGWQSTGTICTNILPDYVLSLLTISKAFVEQHWHSPVEYKLSKGFGLTFLTYYFDFGTFTQNLLYAIIDSVEYGTQVNRVHEINEPFINTFFLEQNYPNPFNPSTTIKYTLPKTEKVKIAVFNMLGQKIETLINEEKPAGSYTIEFTAKNLPSGVYLYMIKAGEYQETKKMILLR